MQVGEKVHEEIVNHISLIAFPQRVKIHSRSLQDMSLGTEYEEKKMQKWQSCKMWESVLAHLKLTHTVTIIAKDD